MNSRGFRIPVALILCAAIAAAAPDVVSAQAGRQEKQPAIKQPRSRRGQKELPQLPELNKKILAFCEINAGKQVGSGECAALAEKALREAGAKPHHEFTAPLSGMTEEDYVWGQLLQPTDPVLPGDVLQFRNVELKFRFANGSTYTQSFAHHTAVVYLTHAPGVFTILQQNVAGPGKTEDQRRLVQPGRIDVRAMTRGTIWAYRPVPKQQP